MFQGIGGKVTMEVVPSKKIVLELGTIVEKLGGPIHRLG